MKSKTESKTEAETPIGHPAHKRWGRNVEVRVATAAEHEWFDAQALGSKRGGAGGHGGRARVVRRAAA